MSSLRQNYEKTLIGPNFLRNNSMNCTPKALYLTFGMQFILTHVMCVVLYSAVKV